jgi:demethylmenaquinone methyltransferase / 2-methoxy-6-polyprenyl-1,4-benzoquinol methylase
MTKTTHFGYTAVNESEKAAKVAAVFDSVASRYDVMNDVMSAGMHRLWKRFAIETAAIRHGERVLDIAGGSGDMSALFAPLVGTANEGGEVWLSDINAAMLNRGRDRLLNRGIHLPVVQCNAETLPFPDAYFDCVCVAFGLRNMTHKDAALKEMLRVLRPGGRVIVLEFSKVWQPLQPLYDVYSFKLLPLMGKLIAKDDESYRYLAESIRMHPSQEALKQMLITAGFARVDFFNLAAGVVAVHRGYKL